MINVSNAFLEKMQESTDFRCHAEITLLDGTVLEPTDNEFTIGGNRILDGAGANSLPLGMAVGRSIEISLMNDEGQFDDYAFFGARIKLWLTFALQDGTGSSGSSVAVFDDGNGNITFGNPVSAFDDGNGNLRIDSFSANDDGAGNLFLLNSGSQSIERVHIGNFTVVSPELRGSTVTISATDDMYRAEKEYFTNLVFPTTLGEMFREACTVCGIPFATSNFNNASFVVDSTPTDVETFRDLFGYIACIAGGNARINLMGNMEILSYNFSASAPRHNLTNWAGTPALDTDNITITGIKTVVSASTEEGTTEEEIICGADGYVLLVDNPLIVGHEQSAVDLIGSILVGVSFRKFDGEHIAYPLAEFMDLAQITDRKGNTYLSVITDIEFVFSACTSFSNSAASAVDNSVLRRRSQESKAIVEAKRLVTEEKTSRQAAVEQLNKNIADSNGLYRTAVDQGDGSQIVYVHDKPSLSESSTVICVTGNSVGVSTDGGQTYSFGFSVDGHLIAGILEAEGINADWIRIGTIPSEKVDGLEALRGEVDSASSDVALFKSYMGFDPVSGLTIGKAESSVKSVFDNASWKLVASGQTVQLVSAADGAQFSAININPIDGAQSYLRLGNLQIIVEADGSLSGRKVGA